MLKDWKLVRSKNVGEYRIFKIRSDEKISPRTGQPHDFFVIESVDWVNVIALTPRDELVMVEQYRHGSNTVELEIPGGMMDPHEADPVVAGQRELREETGYQGGSARLIGTVYPNPAIQTNRCHTVLVENCELRHATDFDHGEDIAVRLVPVAELAHLIATGRIRHALVVVALTHFLLHRQSRSLTAA